MPTRKQAKETMIFKEARPSMPGVTSPETQYEANITLDNEGNIIAPQGMTAEQIAIMIPGSFGAATPEQIKGAAKEPMAKEPAEFPAESIAPSGRKPPEGFTPTDYSPEGRRRFEAQILQDMGFNPITFDPYAYVNAAMREIPALFNHVFGGRIMWADRNKLTKKELDHWTGIMKMFRANKFQEGQQIQKRGLQYYNWMMNKFDKETKAKETALKRLREESKAPTVQQMQNEKGELTWHQWDPATRGWKDTGKKTLAETKAGRTVERQEYTDAVNLVKWLAKQMGDDEFAGLLDNPEMLKKYPALAQAFGKKITDERMKKLYDQQMEIIYKRHGITGEAPEKPERKIVETRTYKGRKLNKYDDGSVEWAD